MMKDIAYNAACLIGLIVVALLLIACALALIILILALWQSLLAMAGAQ